MEKNMYKKIIIYLFVVIFSLTIFLTSNMLAKYAKDIDINTIIKPSDFHFYTSYEDEETYDIYDNKITIDVTNTYLSEATKEDINYIIKVNEVIEVNDGLLKGSVSSTNTHIIDLEYDKTYEVVIQSVNPFKKTITHIFKTHSSTVDSKYTLKDMGDWIEVDLYIGTTCPSKINVVFPSGLLPDNTNPLMNDWYSTSGVINGSEMTKNAHYNLIFFKTDFYSYTNIENGKFVINGDVYSLTINE